VERIQASSSSRSLRSALSAPASASAPCARASSRRASAGATNSGAAPLWLPSPSCPGGDDAQADGGLPPKKPKKGSATDGAAEAGQARRAIPARVRPMPMAW
jgi:hypothetical protein